MLTASPRTVATLAALFSLACADISQAKPPSVSKSDRALAELERSVRDRVDSGNSAGIVAGLLLPDGETRIVARGHVDARGVFEIGSITKLFTGTLLAQMALRGEVSLDQPVAELLPTGVRVPSRNGRQIELGDLATHTGGLPHDPENLPRTNPQNPYAAYTLPELYGFLGDYRLTRDAGSHFEYSNVGVGLLGHALALRAGESYAQLLRDRILAPLGLTMTAVSPSVELRRHIVPGHSADGGVVAPIDLGALPAMGSLRSTATDLLAFAAANIAPPASELGRAMASAQAPRFKIDARTQIGLNWLTLRSGGRQILWHDGGTNGFASFVGIDKARHTAVVVLSSSAGDVSDIGFHALDHRLALAHLPTAIKLPAAVLEHYVGVYTAHGVTASLTPSPTGLIAHIPGRPPVGLYPRSRTKFFLKGTFDEVTFKVDRAGAVTGAVLRQNGQTLAFRKIA